MRFKRNKVWARWSVLCAACLCLSSPARAGEKIRFSDVDEPDQSTSIPKPITRDDKVAARFDFSKKGPGSDGSSALSAPPASNPGTVNPLATRKLEQILDRKKNWLFADPKENNLGLDEVSPANEVSLDAQKKPKKLQEKFFERKEGTKNDSRKQSDSSSALSDEKDAESDSGGLFSQKHEKDSSGVRSLSEMSRTQSLGAFAPSPSEGAMKLDREREQRQHDADFAKIIAPHSAGPSIGGPNDPINLQPDFSRQDANPFAPRSLPSFSSPVDSAPRALGGNYSLSPNLSAIPSLTRDMAPAVTTPSHLAPIAAFADRGKPTLFDPPKRKF